MLGDTVISWQTQKQQSVAVSTTEAEFMALSLTSRQAVWYEHAFNQISHSTDINLYCDNQSGINIAENPVHHQRTKHINIHYHFIQELIHKNRFSLTFVSGDNNVADLMTKGLKLPTHKCHITTIGLPAEREC